MYLFLSIHRVFLGGDRPVINISCLNVGLPIDEHPKILHSSLQPSITTQERRDQDQIRTCVCKLKEMEKKSKFVGLKQIAE